MFTNCFHSMRKKIVFVMFFLSAITRAQQDVAVKLTETDLNAALATVIDARGFNFGDYTGSIIADAWFVNLDAGTVDIKPNKRLTINATFAATAEDVFGFINNVTAHPSFKVHGKIRLDTVGSGYKLMFDPDSISNFSATGVNFIDNLIQNKTNSFINKMPEIELNSGTKLLPEAITSYFTSAMPTLTTTENEIIFYYTVAGARQVIAYNEVNTKNNVGMIEEVVGGSVVSSDKSPRTFWWNSGTTHNLQTPQPLLTETNGMNKYRNWFQDGKTDPIIDVAPRRISVTVDNDATYKAKFDQAQRVQLSNLLEGSYSGGTVSYQNSVGQSSSGTTFDDYDYKGGIGVGNTTVPNGTLGTNWVFSNWSDGNTSQSRSIVVNADKNLVANYKGIHISNQPDAYDNPSQRKVARSAATSYYTNGILHLVYESSGKIWYETSRDNGATWNLENNGQPLNTFTAKNPCIATLLGAYVAIVFEEEAPADGLPRIRLITYDAYNHYKKYDGYVQDKFNNDILVQQYATQNIEPVIAVNTSSGKFIIVWKQEDVEGLPYGGLFSAHGSFWNKDWQYSTITWNGEYDPSFPIPGTNSSSYHPTVNAFATPAADSFALAWEQRNGVSSSHIYYRRMKWNTNQITFEPGQNISSASGYTFNEHPSFITYPDLTARIVWRGRRSTVGELAKASTLTEQKVALFKSTDYYRYWSFGQNVSSPHINKSSDRYVIAWSENSGASNYFTDSRTLSTIHALNTSGEHLQVSNGETAGSMYVVSLQTQGTPPYRFFTSNNIASFGKSEQSSIANGREGVIAKEHAQIYFTLGDVSVDNIPIQFRAIEDTVVFASLSTVNNYLITEPFTLTSSSQLYYGIECGTADTNGIAEALPADAKVRFKVELIDAATQSVIGAFDDVKFSASSLMPYKNIAYSVDTKGIAHTMAQLRLTVEAPPDVEYSIKEKVADGSVLGLGKTVNHRKQISYMGSLAVTEYALSQNYPNPFNPITTISYALPQDGIVTLKIYDALGREVKTLVNEFKTTGRYTVKFDASKLSSGVYIYKLVSGEYSAVKKMALVK